MSLAPQVAVLAVLMLGTSVRAGDEIPTFRQKADLERRFAADVFRSVVQAAHFPTTKHSLDSFEYKDLKESRKEMLLKGKYTGGISRREYTANVVIQLDTRNPKAWEVLRIEYNDNALTAPNRKNLDNLIKKFNSE